MSLSIQGQHRHLHWLEMYGFAQRGDVTHFLVISVFCPSDKSYRRITHELGKKHKTGNIVVTFVPDWL